MKQETPEEAAERIYPMVGNEYLWHVPIQTRKIFIEGAKWQQEKSYSEEDMQKAFMEGHNIYGCVTDNIGEAKECFKEWFEQFKNK